MLNITFQSFKVPSLINLGNLSLHVSYKTRRVKLSKNELQGCPYHDQEILKIHADMGFDQYYLISIYIG